LTGPNWRSLIVETDRRSAIYAETFPASLPVPWPTPPIRQPRWSPSRRCRPGGSFHLRRRLGSPSSRPGRDTLAVPACRHRRRLDRAPCVPSAPPRLRRAMDPGRRRPPTLLNRYPVVRSAEAAGLNRQPGSTARPATRSPARQEHGPWSWPLTPPPPAREGTSHASTRTTGHLTAHRTGPPRRPPTAKA
jgi:hypothetical protein